MRVSLGWRLGGSIGEPLDLFMVGVLGGWNRQNEVG